MNEYEVTLVVDWNREETRRNEFTHYKERLPQVLHNFGFTVDELTGERYEDKDEDGYVYEEGYRGRLVVRKDVYAPNMRRALRTAQEILTGVLGRSGEENDEDAPADWCRAPDYWFV